MVIKTEWQGSEISVSFFSLVPGLLAAGVILFFALVKADLNIALPAAGALLVSFATGLWARLACARLHFTMKPDRERLFPGETLELTLEFKNNKFLPVWAALELPCPPHMEGQVVPGQESLNSGLRLLSWEKSLRVWQLTAKRRGVSALGPARISAGDLLGLGRREKTCSFPREIIVFPRRLAMLPLSIPFKEYFGMHAARGPAPDPAWYAGTRDYSGTLPAKSIDWKASARLGVLQEKLFEPTYHRKVLFVFDDESYVLKKDEVAGDIYIRREEMERDFERMLETLGTLAAALMETGASFGLVSGSLLAATAPNGEPGAVILPAGRGPEHLGSFLEILARAKSPSVAGDETNPWPSRLTAALTEASRAYTGLIYCGASPGKAAENAVRKIGSRKKILFVFSRGEAADLRSEPYRAPAEGTGGAEFLFEGRPACLAGDICYAQEDAR